MATKSLLLKKSKKVASTSKAPSSPPRSLEWNPKGWRMNAVKFVLEHGAAGLFLDPGLGKTSITLASIKILLAKKIIRRVLVIAPLRVVYRVWPAEREKWKNFHTLTMEILHGKDKEKAALREADIYLINPDGLKWLMESGTFDALKFDALVIDEGRRFRKTNTRTFKLIRPLLPTFKRRMLLTGSPNPHGYLDLFGQIYCLDLGRSLGSYITHYRLKFFYPTGYGGYTWKLQPKAEKLIQKAIRPLVLRLEAEDYVKMPKRIPVARVVDLPEDARRIYDELEEDMLSVLKSGKTVVAVNAAVVSGKCAQVANGGIFDTDAEEGQLRKRTWTNLHEVKVEALQEIIDELNGSPALVAYDFEHDLDRLKTAFPKAAFLGKGMSMKDEQEIEDRWNAGEIPVLFGHPASIGHGLNLQESGSRHVIFHSIPWDFELYDQFIRRVARQGNKHARVFVYHLIARDTVDEAKMASLRRKNKTQKGLLDALKMYAKLKKTK